MYNFKLTVMSMARLIEQPLHCIIFRCILDLDGTVTDADIDDQMKKKLAVNVYSGGKWGFFCHLPLKTGLDAGSLIILIELLCVCVHVAVKDQAYFSTDSSWSSLFFYAH